MCLLVTLQRACAALVISGRVLAVVLLLDTVYFACVYETAVIPRTSNDSSHNHVERRITSPQHGTVREFPMALVVASSVAAVSILVFFCLSYVWHTRQLDRRAQKLAIRLAAEADTEINCSQCRAPSSYLRGQSQESVSDSGTEEVLNAHVQRQMDELNSLNEEEEEDEDEDAEGRRRKPGGGFMICLYVLVVS
nr:hypothetical protein BaRGS_015959 [Batillaria attramentaria]